MMMICSCRVGHRTWVSEGDMCATCGFRNVSTLDLYAQLVEQAKAAVSVFVSYAKLHADKGDVAGFQKAILNLNHAIALKVAIDTVEASK